MKYFQQETACAAMSRPVKTVAPEMTLSDLLRLFGSTDFSAFPVVRNQTLVGMVSRADTVKPFAALKEVNGRFDAVMGTTVEQIMSPQVVAVEPKATLEQVIDLMVVHDHESFPVVDHDNRVKGIIARDDIVRALARCTWRAPLFLESAPAGYAIA